MKSCQVFFLLMATGCFSGGDATKRIHVPENPLSIGDADDVVALTQELIRSRPVNPPGNEAAAVRIVAQRLRQGGIEVELHPFSGGERLNLMARLPGSNPQLGPLILVGHSDVVPAKEEDWNEPASPFEGRIQDGVLYGRGALDMLSMVALETMTMLAVKRENAPKERDLILLLVGDEEVDGEGMRSALTRWPNVLKAEWAINEGAFLLQDYFQDGEDVAAVSVAQKGVLQFQLTTTGSAGHGSSPSDDDATHRLIRAIDRILHRHNPLLLTAETERMFGLVGQARGGIDGFVMQNPVLLAQFGRSSLEAKRSTSALVHNTCALTVLEAGYKRNVIPAEAVATFDCRLLPKVDPEKFRNDLMRLVDDPRVEFKVLMIGSANSSSERSRVLDVIRSRIGQEFPATPTIPILTKGLTDSRFLRAQGIASYGFIPVRITQEELSTLHGKNEQIRVEELQKALPRLVDVVVALLGSPAEGE
jgi:acetylornithine deacetylase/succinyl-diaminopimelate desuccinylase-like protein